VRLEKKRSDENVRRNGCIPIADVIAYSARTLERRCLNAKQENQGEFQQQSSLGEPGGTFPTQASHSLPTYHRVCSRFLSSYCLSCSHTSCSSLVGFGKAVRCGGAVNCFRPLPREAFGGLFFFNLLRGFHRTEEWCQGVLCLKGVRLIA
jgi:hypothetical protein